MSVMKKILCSLLTASVLGSFMPVLQAAEPQENTGQTINRPPMVVEADEINFSDSTGDLVAKGNVVIDQDKAEVTGEVVRGNTKANEVWIDGNGRIRQPGMDITGTGTRYNFANHTGTMAQATGKVEKELISGKDVELKSDELVMHDGTWTRCPAKKPDYHMSATKAEIWPGDHMIVYNVKFWIKDTVILSLPSYRVSLKPGSGETSFPRVNFSSANGGSIRQHLEFPVGDKVSLYTNLAYYTHAGYKPVYGVVDHENGYQIGVAEGHYLDSNDNWIKKEPEFTLNFNKRQLGSLPINYTVGASYGKWIDDAKSSWHQSYNVYFSGFPIKLNVASTLNLGTGFTHTHESYDDSSTDKYRYDATLTTKWSPKYSTLLGYHYVSDTTSLFSYDTADMNRELDLGIKWQIDRMNGFGILERYDVDKNRIYDLDYTWYRNLHCFEGSITYRAKRDSWKMDVSLLHF